MWDESAMKAGLFPLEHTRIRRDKISESGGALLSQSYHPSDVITATASLWLLRRDLIGPASLFIAGGLT